MCSGLFENFDDAIQGAFEEFDARHPEVYQEFVKIALELRRRGHERYSADAILHVIRWHRDMDGRDVEKWKLNDHYTRCMSRRAMAEKPELEGFFETRKLLSTVGK
jgi:hypothetical protein